MGWRKIGKKKGSRACMLKSCDSSHFEESFYRLNMIKIECHLLDNVILLIQIFMEIYLEFFQSYQKAKQTPEASPRVNAQGDKVSCEEIQEGILPWDIFLPY